MDSPRSPRPGDSRLNDESPPGHRQGKKAKADGGGLDPEGASSPPSVSAVFRCCRAPTSGDTSGIILQLKQQGFTAQLATPPKELRAQFFRLSTTSKLPRTVKVDNDCLLVRDDTWGCTAHLVGFVSCSTPLPGCVWETCAALSEFLSCDVLQEDEPSITVRPKLVTKLGADGTTTRASAWGLWSTKPQRASRLMMLCGDDDRKRSQLSTPLGRVTCTSIRQGTNAAIHQAEQLRTERRARASQLFGRRIVLFLSDLTGGPTPLPAGEKRQLAEEISLALGGTITASSVDVFLSRAGNPVAFATLATDDEAAAALENGVRIRGLLIRCELARKPEAPPSPAATPPSRTKPPPSRGTPHPQPTTQRNAHGPRSYADAAASRTQPTSSTPDLEERLFQRLEERLSAALDAKIQALADTLTAHITELIANQVARLFTSLPDAEQARPTAPSHPPSPPRRSSRRHGPQPGSEVARLLHLTDSLHHLSQLHRGTSRTQAPPHDRPDQETFSDSDI